MLGASEVLSFFLQRKECKVVWRFAVRLDESLSLLRSYRRGCFPGKPRILKYEEQIIRTGIAWIRAFGAVGGSGRPDELDSVCDAGSDPCGFHDHRFGVWKPSIDSGFLRARW